MFHCKLRFISRTRPSNQLEKGVQHKYRLYDAKLDSTGQYGIVRDSTPNKLKCLWSTIPFTKIISIVPIPVIFSKTSEQLAVRVGCTHPPTSVMKLIVVYCSFNKTINQLIVVYCSFNKTINQLIVVYCRFNKTIHQLIVVYCSFNKTIIQRIVVYCSFNKTIIQRIVVYCSFNKTINQLIIVYCSFNKRRNQLIVVYCSFNKTINQLIIVYKIKITLQRKTCSKRNMLVKRTRCYKSIYIFNKKRIQMLHLLHI